MLPWILHSRHLQHFLSFVLHVTVCQKKETDYKLFHTERKNKRQTSRQIHLSSPRSTTVSVCVCVCVCDLIPIPFAAKDTLSVSCLDTQSVETPVVTGLGQGDRLKILIHQVFNRCVQGWDRYE